MTGDDLRQLDLAYRRSPRECNIALDAMLAAHPEQTCRIKRSLRRVYLSQHHILRLGHGPDQGVVELGALLHTAGVGPAMRRLRDEHCDIHPAHPHLHVPDEPWVLDNEADSDHSPIEQVQACLIVLTDIHPAVTSWARKLARRRLVDLILEYPILLHERFVWSIRVRLFLAVPLLHVLTLAPAAALPSPLFDIEPKRLRAFALHPMLAHATRAKSPRLATTMVRPAAQGRTFYSLMRGRPLPLFYLGYALLYLDRIRTQEQASPGLYTSTAECAAAMLAMADRTLFDCWNRPRPRAGADDFVAELRAAACVPAAALRPLVIARAPSIFVFTADNRLVPAVAADALERYGRLHRLLLELRLAESPGAAARLIVDGIFAGRPPMGMPAVATDQASVEVATALVDHWRRDGVQASELLARARYAAPAWSQALSAASLAYGESTFH